jgi:hypothetical protein
MKSLSQKSLAAQARQRLRSGQSLAVISGGKGKAQRGGRDGERIRHGECGYNSHFTGSNYRFFESRVLGLPE